MAAESDSSLLRPECVGHTILQIDTARAQGSAYLAATSLACKTPCKLMLSYVCIIHQSNAKEPMRPLVQSSLRSFQREPSNVTAGTCCSEHRSSECPPWVLTKLLLLTRVTVADATNPTSYRGGSWALRMYSLQNLLTIGTEFWLASPGL